MTQQALFTSEDEPLTEVLLEKYRQEVKSGNLTRALEELRFEDLSENQGMHQALVKMLEIIHQGGEEFFL